MMTESLLQRLGDVTKEVLFRIAQLVIVGFFSIYYITETVILTLTPPSLRKEKNLKGKNILITGGAGGVGRELTLLLAKEGANIIIWDTDESAMKNVAEKIEDAGFKVHTYPVDISEREIVYKYADVVKTDIGDVDIVINNAGIVCGRTFLDIPDKIIEKTFKVNTLSHYWVLKAFLPYMMSYGGHIVTIGSLTGLLGTYNCTDYSASKHAVIGFHESLLIELKANGYDKVHMTLVCPYFINTGMFVGCQPRNLPMLSPKYVAQRIIEAIKKEEEFLTIPTFSRFVIPLKFFMPAKLNWEFLNRIIQGPQSMRGLKSPLQVEAA